MKTTILTIIILFLTLFSVMACNVTGNHYGIVSASKLAVRKDQNKESELIKYYDFGTPVVIINKGEKDTIGGITDYWYQDESTNGWLFGGYLLLTDSDGKVAKFTNERIKCHWPCGGNSCFFEFEAYLVGDYYISRYFLNDYPIDSNLDYGIIIGKYIQNEETILFEKPLNIAGYDTNAKYVENLSSLKYGTKEYLEDEFKLQYYKNRDDEGEYYSYQKEKDPFYRKYNREKCKNGTEPIWIDVVKIQEMSINDMQNEFPLIKEEK